MRTWNVLLLMLALVLTLGGCATSFTGAAHVDGPADCKKKCSGWGLEFTGMVALGNYSSACICSRPGKAAKTSEAAASGAVAGVYTQMQRQQAE